MKRENELTLSLKRLSVAVCLGLLSGCDPNPSAQNPSPNTPPNPPNISQQSVCSTLTNTVSSNCKVETNQNGRKVLAYTLEASTTASNIPVGGGTPIRVNDTFVYNKSLSPERLEIRPGDELRINFTNNINVPARFDALRDEVLASTGMYLQFTNLHTHGLVTPWEFKNNTNTEIHGDNVLSVLLSSAAQPTQPPPAGIDPANICSTNGSVKSFRYPIAGDHSVGLDWYHPHPHGVTGLQVEGGLSGLLLVGDEKAEKEQHPVYLQLKDMQTKKVAKAQTTDPETYQFEKFVPDVATVCHDKIKDATSAWVFDSDDKGRCNYHNGSDQYSWLFLVNGQLYPEIKVAEQAFFRIANSSSNASYRLVLIPKVATTLQPNQTYTYYTPTIRSLEKDGATLVGDVQNKDVCSLAMTTSTRLGVGVNFTDLSQASTVCELTVKVDEVNGQPRKSYSIAAKTVDAALKEKITKQEKYTQFVLTQAGLDTGEDDWPSVELALLTLDKTLPNSDADKYVTTATSDVQSAARIARDDVKAPDDSCAPTHPAPMNSDGIVREVVLYYGKTPKDGNEHFGLVATEEKNAGANNTSTPVTDSVIQKWRKEYQVQFASPDMAKAAFNKDKGFQEYDAPNLESMNLSGLVDHYFRLQEGKPIPANICTQISPTAEKWRIQNLSAQIHNFHIHQMKFHVVNVRGATCTTKAEFLKAQTPDMIVPKALNLVDNNGYILASYDKPDKLADARDDQCLKTYAELFHNVPSTYEIRPPVVMSAPSTAARTMARAAPATPAADIRDFGWHDTFPVPPMGYIDIELPFDRPEKMGEYVFHCHILEHEDAGMMGKIVVKPAS